MNRRSLLAAIGFAPVAAVSAIAAVAAKPYAPGGVVGEIGPDTVMQAIDAAMKQIMDDQRRMIVAHMRDIKARRLA